MARPRKNDPTVLITPLIQDFAIELGRTIEKFTTERIQKQIEQALRNSSGPRGGGRRRRRAEIQCYFPGCQNTAAPRFGMFCAALHKKLPKTAKAKYRLQRNGESQAKART